MYGCICICMLCVPTESRKRHWILGSFSYNGYELPEMDAGTWTWDLWKNIKCSYLLSSFSSPSLSHLHDSSFPVEMFTWNTGSRATSFPKFQTPFVYQKVSRYLCKYLEILSYASGFPGLSTIRLSYVLIACLNWLTTIIGLFKFLLLPLPHYKIVLYCITEVETIAKPPRDFPT